MFSKFLGRGKLFRLMVLIKYVTVLFGKYPENTRESEFTRGYRLAPDV